MSFLIFVVSEAIRSGGSQTYYSAFLGFLCSCSPDGEATAQPKRGKLMGAPRFTALICSLTDYRHKDRDERFVGLPSVRHQVNP
jgi:hypothetical protein